MFPSSGRVREKVPKVSAAVAVASLDHPLRWTMEVDREGDTLSLFSPRSSIVSPRLHIRTVPAFYVFYNLVP